MSSLLLQNPSGLGDTELEIDFPDSMQISGHDFDELCARNPNLSAELSKEGTLIIMAPTGGSTGWRNSDITAQLQTWARKNGQGLVFDSSTLFTLPDGSKRGPDASWVQRDRWNSLSQEEKDGFPPLCPDLVIELRSPSDRISMLQAKMQAYLENGAKLGLLIDPIDQSVWLCRPKLDATLIKKPKVVSADPECPGLEFDLETIWKESP